MNYSTAVFLINKDVQAVACSYEVHPDGKPVTPLTIYKSLDKTLKSGDYVVVPTDTRHKFTVVRVEQVGAEIDLDSGTQLKWIVSKFDREAYAGMLTQEQAAIDVIKSAELRRKRDELRKAVMIDQTAETELKALPIYLNGNPALPSS